MIRLSLEGTFADALSSDQFKDRFNSYLEDELRLRKVQIGKKMKVSWRKGKLSISIKQPKDKAKIDEGVTVDPSVSNTITDIVGSAVLEAFRRTFDDATKGML